MKEDYDYIFIIASEITVISRLRLQILYSVMFTDFVFDYEYEIIGLRLQFALLNSLST